MIPIPGIPKPYTPLPFGTYYYQTLQKPNYYQMIQRPGYYQSLSQEYKMNPGPSGSSGEDEGCTPYMLCPVLCPCRCCACMQRY
jgi:hypothetical protein